MEFPCRALAVPAHNADGGGPGARDRDAVRPSPPIYVCMDNLHRVLVYVSLYTDSYIHAYAYASAFVVCVGLTLGVHDRLDASDVWMAQRLGSEVA